MSVFNLCHLRLISILRFSVTLIGLLWSGVLASRAANYYVATNGIDGTGLDWGHAASNIQYAVDLAITPNDTVWVSNGSYCVTNQITITNNITVRGVNGWTNTIVYADWPAYTDIRCFYVSRTGTVDGFMITNGHYMAASSNMYTGGGGALLATGTIQNCYFRNNICSNSGDYSGGGGVYISGTGTVLNCIFVTNTVFIGTYGSANKIGGGGIFIRSLGTVIGCHLASNSSASGSRGCGIWCDPGSAATLISNCTFSANFAVGGYGLAFNLSAGLVTDCIITNHLSSGNGCVIFNYSQLRNCLIANNESGNAVIIARYGGSISNCTIVGNKSTWSNAKAAGVDFDDGQGAVLESCIISNNILTAGKGAGGVALLNSAAIRNCLIHNNSNMSTAGQAGGVFLTNAAINQTTSRTNIGVINCTIVNNYSTNEGGGITTAGQSNYIVNCIIAGNSSYSGNYPNVYHRDNAGANKSNYYYSCVITAGTYLAENQGNITNDPVFAGASAGNWRLNGNSPCVNTGTNISWMTNSYDLDRKTRIRYGAVDMGAYECIYDGTIYKLW